MEDMSNASLLDRFADLDSAAVSDALDRLGLPAGVGGIAPVWGPASVVGFAVTVALEPRADGPAGAHIATTAVETADEFLARFAQRVGGSPYFGSGLYASSLPHKVRAGAVRAIFESMVDLSDHGKLVDRLLGLPAPRMFVYGEQNDSLSYLPTLAEAGVELAGISHSAHFPMYSNAPEMWARITDFVSRADAGANSHR